MTHRKAISYCFPTSPNAETLGKHGYYIEMSTLNEAGEWSVGFIHQGHDVFDHAFNPDLIALYAEIDAEPSPFCITLSDFL
jgi:hypothetical protein